MSNATALYGVNAALFTAQSPITPPQFSGLDLKQFSPGTTRVLGHILVTLVVLIAGRLGQNTMTDVARSSLWAGKMVPLSYLGGWMTPAEMMSWMWKFREVPGGFYFAPMGLTVLFGIAANLLIANFVTAVAVPAMCTGQVAVATVNSPVSYTEAQSPLIPGFGNALQAQVYSMANGGLPGLYWAAPADPVFRATENDVASSCSCAFSWTSTRVTNTDNTATQNTVLAGVEVANRTVTCYNLPNYVVTGCVAVSTDFTDPDNLQVQFAIDSPLPDNSAVSEIGYNLTLNGYTCSLTNLPWLQAIVLGVPFSGGLSSVLEPRIVYDTGAMEDVLMLMTNTMLAINAPAPAGSANLTDAAEFGCIKVASRVQLPACIFISACFVALVGWAIARLVALIMARKTLDACPMGLEGWMDQAIRGKGASDIFGDTRISPERRRDWAVAIHTDSVDGAQYIGLVDRRSKS